MILFDQFFGNIQLIWLLWPTYDVYVYLMATFIEKKKPRMVYVLLKSINQSLIYFCITFETSTSSTTCTFRASEVWKILHKYNEQHIFASTETQISF